MAPSVPRHQDDEGLIGSSAWLGTSTYELRVGPLTWAGPEPNFVKKPEEGGEQGTPGRRIHARLGYFDRMAAERRTSRKPKRGPRPGEDTYGLILQSALEQFAQNGYTGASIRSIARGAGVDPALVHHYFDGKEQLFDRTISELNVNPAEVVERLVSLPRELVPAALLHGFLSAYDTPDGQLRFLTLFRATSSEEGLARARDHFIDDVIGSLVEKLGLDHPRLRSNLVASQLIGLAMARYVLKLEPVTSISMSNMISAYVPTFTRYLYEELPEPLQQSLETDGARPAEESAG